MVAFPSAGGELSNLDPEIGEENERLIDRLCDIYGRSVLYSQDAFSVSAEPRSDKEIQASLDRLHREISELTGISDHTKACLRQAAERQLRVEREPQPRRGESRSQFHIDLWWSAMEAKGRGCDDGQIRTVIIEKCQKLLDEHADCG